MTDHNDHLEFANEERTLLAAILHQAVKDARQTRDPALQVEARTWLLTSP